MQCLKICLPKALKTYLGHWSSSPDFVILVRKLFVAVDDNMLGLVVYE
nr:P5.4 [Lettuce chlorosis virus]